MNPPAIEMKDVSFSYEDNIVLEDVTFSLKQGDFLGIIGPNGSGKTTLLKILIGLLKPEKGTVRVLGETPHDAKHRIGYVPQNVGINTSFPISVFDIALMGRLSKSRIGRRFTQKDRSKVEEVLKDVGMWGYAQTHIGKLSGGQRQRVFIARALVTNPEILFLDEPTANVDTDFETDLFEYLKDLNKNVTIAVITHDIGALSRHVKSIACVNRNLIFHEGGKVTPEMMKMAYPCPVDLIAHGIPHRVLSSHVEK